MALYLCSAIPPYALGCYGSVESNGKRGDYGVNSSESPRSGLWFSGGRLPQKAGGETVTDR